MQRRLIVERLKGLAGALAFVGLGLFLRWADGPPGLGWFMIGIGTLGVLGIIAVTLRPSWGAQTDAGESPSVVLKDGRDYRADVSDIDVALTHLQTADVRRMMWNDVTSIYTIAIDGYPAGRISWVLHTNGERLEIPWDVQGNNELMSKMQDKFPDLDNRAIIESAGMLHGFRKLWPPA
jgi:hypothetical protein